MNRKIFIYSVVASILATILFSYCLHPASIWVWHLMASTSNSLVAALQDQTVLNAAIGKRDWISPMCLGVAASFTLGFAASLLISPILARLLTKRVSDRKSVV